MMKQRKLLIVLSLLVVVLGWRAGGLVGNDKKVGGCGGVWAVMMMMGDTWAQGQPG